MPTGGLDVQDGVFDSSQIQQMLAESGLDLVEVSGYLGAFLAAKYRQLLFFSVVRIGKMNFTVTNLDKIKSF